ncbi:MAG TPA: MATE family efflux transporter [Clostridia bacterium]|nr:MATE family efflux transporter [Clostridia bacterium]
MVRLSIEKELTKLSIPMLIGMIFELICTLLDIFWIARIDPGNTAIVSGVGLIYPVAFLLVALIQGISTGISTIVAIAAGRKDEEYTGEVGRTGFNMSFYSSMVIIILTYVFSGSIINLLAGNGISAAAKEYAMEYLMFYMPGIFFLFCAQAYLALLQGQGNTKHVGMAMSFSTIVNAILDPVFIFVLGLGVKGAAITTSIAQVLLFGYTLMVMLRQENKPISVRGLTSVNFPIIREILKLGIPQSVSFIILSASFGILNWFVSSISETFMNSYTIVSRFDGILLTPTLAFSIGLSIMIGQNYGAGNIEEMKSILIRGTGLNMIISILTGLLYMVTAKPLFGTMTGNPEVITLAVKQVYYLTIVTTAGSVLGLCAGSAFQAIEKPVSSTFIMLLRMLLITVPCIIILRLILGNTVENVWISITLGSLTGGIIGYGMILGNINKLIVQSQSGLGEKEREYAQ